MRLDAEALNAVLDAYPERPFDEDTVAYFDGLLKQELRVGYCNSCTRHFAPIASVCPSCWSREVRPVALAPTGVIELMTVLRQGAPHPEAVYPFTLVAVAFDGSPGVRVSLSFQPSAEEAARIGMRVALRWGNRIGAPWPYVTPA